ncbi:unnamed protein product [Rhizoctonia solani]|uniref:Ricin B lectin domain-containing protein n=1 Tax=Rhizoctonia solani TaxID=456999 RepID=A0A8H3DW83_9AGAM|nr:unnamed protein product [Rhizoctonia solani]
MVSYPLPVFSAMLPYTQARRPSPAVVISEMALSPGVYRIRNARTNTYIDQKGSSTDVIHGWNYVQHDRADQHWFAQLSGDGVVFKNVEYGQYAYTTNIQNGGKVFASNNLIIWNLSRNENEWTISCPGTNYVVEIRDANKANGAGINLWENLGLQHQRWIFEKISDRQPQELNPRHLPQHYQLSQDYFQQPNQQSTLSPVLPGIYFLRNVMSNALVSLPGGSAEEGAEISGYGFSGGNHQKWQLQSTGHGRNVTFRNVQTNTYLWFRGESFVPSFSVKSSYQSQEYAIATANRGFYILPAQQPGCALSLLHGSAQNGTEIAIWHNDQQDNQKWHLEHA